MGKASKRKRMAGATQAVSSDRTPRGLTGHPIIPGPRPNPSTLDLVIALLTGIIVMGVLHG